ncbi:hypothetical protein E2C01_072680 [Portunus trituberculatus]|uniref:Uncharacterized protein n=1 Tax=Portunus trituberculatus TaxID=210409 RepID=A0A5B7IBD2_PORTR|nr:hypothetical protein [Portunus trituberculatus]
MTARLGLLEVPAISALLPMLLYLRRVGRVYSAIHKIYKIVDKICIGAKFVCKSILGMILSMNNLGRGRGLGKKRCEF